MQAIIDKPARSRKARASKTVQVVARITFRQPEQSIYVVYIVRSSKSDATYETTLVAGRATGCTCRELPDGRIAPHACYHMSGCECLEAERAQELHDAAIVESVLLPEMVASGDVTAHIEDSIASGELADDPWSDPEYNPFAGMTEDEKRAARYYAFESEDAA